jgi:hypothetical protein
MKDLQELIYVQAYRSAFRLRSWLFHVIREEF